MRSKLFRHLALGIALCASGLAGLAQTESVKAEGPLTDGHPMIGEDAPPFALTEVDGSVLSLEELRGKYVVIHFGASW